MRVEKTGAILVGFFTIACPGIVLAQAWVPPKGTTAVTYLYEDGYADKHLFSVDVGNGTNELDLGKMYSRTSILGFEYGLGQRLAMTSSVAYVSTRYDGTAPENPQIDDGEWHATFGDASFTLRYKFLSGAWALTPIAGFSFPTHDYPIMGHTTAGSGRNTASAGLVGGWVLDPGTPKLYLEGDYIYSWGERFEGFSANSSNTDLEIGWFATNWLTLRGFGNYHHADGGIDWATDIVDAHSGHAHDAVAAAGYYRAGAGASFTVSKQWDLYLFWEDTLSGENTTNLRTLAFGVAWNFQRITLPRPTAGLSGGGLIPAQSAGGARHAAARRTSR